MRLLQNSANLMEEGQAKALEFADWLLNVGNGDTDLDLRDQLRVPAALLHHGMSVDSLIAAIYDNFEYVPILTPLDQRNNFAHRALLAARNVDVDTLNTNILASSGGDT
jgi:hypothetical protein